MSVVPLLRLGANPSAVVRATDGTTARVGESMALDKRGRRAERVCSRERGIDMEQPRSGWAVGWIFFAGILMIMLGGWWMFAGLVGIIDDKFYVKGAKYVMQFDTTTWGWIHLIMGLIVLLAGLALFSGAVWARTVGVILAVISGLVAFAWLPWYPFWAIIFIVASVAIIWALTAHGRDVTDAV